MPISDPMVMPLARELLECFEQELAKVEDPPAHIQLRPGTTVDFLLSTTQDECCEGLGWVRPAGFVPSSTTFPVQDPAPIKGGVRAWAVTLEMGVVRCAPTPPEDRIPTGEEWDVVTQAVMDDAAAMRRALCCFINGAPGRSGRVLAGGWTPVAVQGGCVGGIMPITIQGPACDCSEAGPISS
jgi:hypothetical protein